MKVDEIMQADGRPLSPRFVLRQPAQRVSLTFGTPKNYGRSSKLWTLR
jgi:hypothetical protein